MRIILSILALAFITATATAQDASTKKERKAKKTEAMGGPAANTAEADAEPEAKEGLPPLEEGRKLNLKVELQPELIGGVRVVVGDEVLDTSIKARLEQMKVALTA